MYYKAGLWFIQVNTKLKLTLIKIKCYYLQACACFSHLKMRTKLWIPIWNIKCFFFNIAFWNTHFSEGIHTIAEFFPKENIISPPNKLTFVLSCRTKHCCIMMWFNFSGLPWRDCIRADWPGAAYSCVWSKIGLSYYFHLILYTILAHIFWITSTLVAKCSNLIGYIC